MAGTAVGAASISGTVTNTPWSGPWLPYKDDPNQLNLHDPGGPIDKLDQLRELYYPGTDARGLEWEREHHTSALSWEGHCQAWAAASILVPEPPAGGAVFARPGDPRGDLVFTQDDIEALHAASLVQVGNLSWGTRVRSAAEAQPGNEAYEDINPAVMHHLLVDKVANNGESFIMDTEAGEPVWNFPVTGFDAQITERHDDGSISYRTTVHFAAPGDNVTGTTPLLDEQTGQPKVYTYRLYPAGNNQMTGVWTGSSVNDHPDFAWVPDPTRQMNYETTHRQANPWVTTGGWVDFIAETAAEQEAERNGTYVG